MGTGGPLNIWVLSGAGPHRAFSANLSKSNTESPRGGGPSKVYGSWGRLPHGVPRADFFSGSRTFDFFSRNQRFQTRPRPRPGPTASRINGLPAGTRTAPASSRVGNAIIFPMLSKAPGGHLKVQPDRQDDRVAAPRRFLRVSRNFFWSRTHQNNCREIQGGGGRSHMT